MPLIGPNPKSKTENAAFEMNCPDTLQNLCIFYLMNNLDVLAPCLNKISESNEEFVSSLTMLLGNKMMKYYSQWGTPCDHEEPYIDEVVKKFNCCTEISISNDRGYTNENLMTLARSFKSVKKLHLTCFESHYQLEALRILCENNLRNLSTVVLTQKCEEDETIGYLNLLGGKDFDCDIPESCDSDDDDTDVNKKAEGENTDESNTQAGLGNETEEINRNEEGRNKSSDTATTDLTSFSYYQVYSSVHPNIRPSMYYGWFFNLLSGVISHNLHLKSFRLVTHLTNAIEWFLSQPDVPKLQDLQSLSLSFEYFVMYTADAEEMKIPYIPNYFTKLPLLQSLRHLDVCCNLPFEEFDEYEPYLYTEKEVDMFVEALKEMPQLKSLDISGTNLATIIQHSDKSDKICRDHCMPGFEGRRFEFLGLYGTEACTHKFIPADRVSGNANIDQLIEALYTLQHNKTIASLILRDISSWIQEHPISPACFSALIDGFLMLITKIGQMDACRTESEEFEEKTIVRVLETTYKLIVDNGLEGCFTVRQKRLLLDHIMAVCDLEGWRRTSKIQLMEYSMLLIVQLKLGNTAVYSYRFKQYVLVLVTIFRSAVGKDKKVHAINELLTACNSSQEYKIVAGSKLKLVQILLNTIEQLLIEEVNENLNLHRVWKVLGTLTDEVSCNCEMFVENKGCQISKLCINKYPHDKCLHQLILGILVDVSNTRALTSWLMTPDIMSVCRQLMTDANGKGSNVSFHAAGLMLKLVSYGPEAWTVAEPRRDDIIKEVDKVIHTWDVSEPICNDKFRSLSTLLSQLENYSTPVLQHWSAWLLCNLITVTPETYCDQLETEDGLSKIENVLQERGVRDDIVTLLQSVRIALLKHGHS